MFNALRPEQLLVGVGRSLRAAADANGPLEDYQRSQTLSAYSVTRLLAAELAGAAELLAWARAAFTRALTGDDRARVGEARERIAQAATGVELGDAVADLLAALPRDPDDKTRTAVQHVLRELTDREQSALAAPLPG